jgi:hypothetical protein
MGSNKQHALFFCHRSNTKSETEIKIDTRTCLSVYLLQGSQAAQTVRRANAVTLRPCIQHPSHCCLKPPVLRCPCCCRCHLRCGDGQSVLQRCDSSRQQRNTALQSTKLCGKRCPHSIRCCSFRTRKRIDCVLNRRSNRCRWGRSRRQRCR